MRDQASVAGRQALERLDIAERWMVDALSLVDRPGGVLSVDVDMSATVKLLAALRAHVPRATFTHVMVRAAGLALARNPELVMVVAGNLRGQQSQVDVVLSVAGSTFVAPVLKLKDVGARLLPEIAADIVRRAPEVREREQADLALARVWGWLVPFSSHRRWLLARLLNRVSVRRELVGALQITCDPYVDEVTAGVVLAAGAIGVGCVRERVIVVDGQAEVRPTVRITCAVNHSAWDGQRARCFLKELRAILEEGQLAAEVG